jgi:hypothetical protein
MVIRNRKSKKDRQHNRQKKKDKQISTNYYADNNNRVTLVTGVKPLINFFKVFY